MLYTTRGIVLRTIRYNDKALIANIYTELFGMLGYIVHPGKNKKNALFQPLTCLEITADNKTNKRLQHIKEAVCSPQFVDIPYNTLKSSLAIFIAEVFYRSVKEEENNIPLFNFLYSTSLLLDKETENCSNFHLAFLVELTGYLGFFPGNEYSEANNYFDLEEGVFFSEKPLHSNIISGETARFLAELTHNPLKEHSTIAIHKSQRKELLHALMNYYRLHLQGMSEVRSHMILEDVMG